LPFESSKDLNDKVTKLNFIWQGLQNGMVSGDTAIKQISEAYGIDAADINFADKKDEIIDTYVTSKIAANKAPSLDELNKIFTTFNAGKEPGDKGYMEPFTGGEVLLSDSYVTGQIFTHTARTDFDPELVELFNGKGLKITSGEDLKGTSANLKKFKDLYNNDAEVKAYIDEHYTPA